MVLFLAGSQRASVDISGPMAWQWQPYDQGLPTYAMVVTVAVQPTDPSVIYAATYEPPGLWRSDDRGQSWEVDDLGLEGSPVYALHWDTVRRQWWTGTQDGLYTRSEADSPWQASGLRESAVYAIAEDGKGRLYLATESGLFGSADAEGTTWEAMPMAGPAGITAILALAVSPDGRTLLSGMAGQGLWVSRNGGATWSPAADPSTEAGKVLAQAYVTAVLLDPTTGGATYGSTSERAHQSVDGGATWQPMTGLEGGVYAFATGADGSAYAAMVGQVARSSDGGRTWELHGAGLRPDDRVLDLAVSPADPARLYAAAWDGLYVSSDNGQSWERRSNGPGYPDVNVLAWDGSGDLLAGTRSGLYRRTRGQLVWEPIPCSGGRAVLALADAGNGRDFYAGLSGGLARSTGRGANLVRSPFGDDRAWARRPGG